MPTFKYLTLLTAACCGLISLALAQDPHDPDSRVLAMAAAPAAAPNANPEQGPPPDRRGGMPPFRLPLALRDALDTDGDGVISAEEIRKATESLKKLDKNKDGKLTAEELGWPPQMPDFGRGGRGPGGGPGFVERLRSRDANGDGKVTAAELPKSMQFLIRLGDTDGDGALDAKEIEQLAKKLGFVAEPQAARPQPR